MNQHQCHPNARERQYDARGIYLCYTCDECHDQKMRSYRPEVLFNPNYECDEVIDDDY